MQADELLSRLKEAEELLRFPAVAGHVERASKLLLTIARQAPNAAARSAAMKAITLANLARNASPLSDDSGNLDRLIQQLRQALQAN